jgi:citrate synthase
VRTGCDLDLSDRPAAGVASQLAAVVKGILVSTGTAVKGLKGVIAADSAVCDIDGNVGKLIYRGYNIHELARNSTFEETCYLLLKGDLPNKSQLDEFSAELSARRPMAPELTAFLQTLPQDVGPMSALRTAVSIAGMYDHHAEDASPAAIYEKTLNLIAEMTTQVAAIHRRRKGLPFVEPNPKLSHAGNFLYMLNGKEPSADATRAMDMILVLHAEHAFNASTFAARVIAATLSDLYSVITGAIGALKGPLHGGANTEVLQVLQKIGSVDNVEKFVEETRASKGKFMGFGHAVYLVQDPRAVHLKDLSKRLGQETGDPKWYEISEKLEAVVTKAINKPVNVDFYSASLQHYMGIPGELFTCVFAASRIAGWCAHVLEQWQDNKIIRPSSAYTGPAERSYVAIDKR